MSGWDMCSGCMFDVAFCVCDYATNYFQNSKKCKLVEWYKIECGYVQNQEKSVKKAQKYDEKSQTFKLKW